MERKPDWLPGFPVQIYCNSEVVLDEDNPQTDGGKAAAGISVHAAVGIEQ